MEELLRWADITRVDAPWAYFIACTESDADGHASEQSSEMTDCVTRIIRGRRCSTKEGLFHEWAAAFQFPYYFGHNWDAWHECVRDLDWLYAPSYVVVQTRIDEVLAEHPEDFRIYIELLQGTAEEWLVTRRAPVAFRVVFQARERNAGDAIARLERAGVSLQIRRARSFARRDEPET